MSKHNGLIFARSSSLVPFYLSKIESYPLDKMTANFAKDIFIWIFVNEKFYILIDFSLKFVPKGPIDK